jgi:hypothetical protein
MALRTCDKQPERDENSLKIEYGTLKIQVRLHGPQFAVLLKRKDY